MKSHKSRVLPALPLTSGASLTLGPRFPRQRNGLPRHPPGEPKPIRLTLPVAGTSWLSPDRPGPARPPRPTGDTRSARPAGRRLPTLPPGPTSDRPLTGGHGDPSRARRRAEVQRGRAGRADGAMTRGRGAAEAATRRRAEGGGRRAEGGGSRQGPPRLTKRSRRRLPPPAQLRAGRRAGRPHALTSARRHVMAPPPRAAALHGVGGAAPRGLGELERASFSCPTLVI